MVVIHHLPGWDEWIIEVTRKFAHHGYAAIAPHLYFRDGPGDPDDIGARVRAAGGVADDQVLGDVVGAMTFLRAQEDATGKIGLIGFCSGGRHAYLCACRIDSVDAIVDCWGGNVIVDDKKLLNAKRPTAPIDLTDGLRCPLLGQTRDHAKRMTMVSLKTRGWMSSRSHGAGATRPSVGT
jgi:carboxymethylenebutenolidase